MDAKAYAEQAAAMVGLTIAPEHQPGVVMNLELAARMAALVATLPLGRDDEPAPVFVAGKP